MEEKRIKTIGHFIQNLEALCGDLYDNGDTQLGYFEKNLFLHGLKPLPTTPYFGFSLSAMQQAIYKFDESAGCACKRGNHLQIVRNKILGCMVDSIKYYKNGLDILEFKSNQ
jgi:hypothetical protein